MPLRSFGGIDYIPILALKPAEMQALQELPDVDKQTMMPLFLLGPWGAAHHFQNALSRIEDAYGARPCFVALSDFETPSTERPVHGELAALRNPDDGYAAWCDFIESNPTFVPNIQIGDPRQIVPQTSRLHGLGRGVMVLIERPGFAGTRFIAEAVASVTNGGTDVCFMLDLKKINADLISINLLLAPHIREIRQAAPNAYLTVSASSFPDSFSAINSQEIFERRLFAELAVSAEGRLIYSDRGSARAERLGGGGGPIPPRIDYATQDMWTFFRATDDTDKNAAYAEQARLALASSGWDPNLRIWGTQMIERTALGDLSAIISAKRCTAARINIHLHRQTFYNDVARLYATDDDWSD